MNGVSRFLSRRDKKHKSGAHNERHHSHANKDLYKIFIYEDSKKAKDKEEEKKVKAILPRLEAAGITGFRDVNVEYALRSRASEGDVEKAYELLVLFEDALQDKLRPYSKDTKLLGAENRELVTCYLDSLLFAMFARLDSFENMIAVNFQDTAKRKLVVMLRLWVNMLRCGRLIPTEITKHLQDALGACGWEEATKLRQQDVSEAFTFITGKLELPLLSLKMDVYHTGKDDVDDHKIVKERLLEVAIPEPTKDGSEIKLEDCLEAYFNNRVEVKRDLQRRNTLQSVRSEKGQGLHLETTELDSPGPSTPTPLTPHDSKGKPPFLTRGRGDSIFNKRIVLDGGTTEPQTTDDINLHKRARAPTIKKEVLMPAWQFFSLIPSWNNYVKPATDVQVAQHLSSKRPILGICLKRYSMTAQGVGSRRDTYIDIPLEIGLPHFISDEPTDDFGATFTNFKLSLQSVICHRGTTVNSGHYVALVRGDATNAVHPTAEPEQPQHESSHPAQSSSASQIQPTTSLQELPSTSGDQMVAATPEETESEAQATASAPETADGGMERRQQSNGETENIPDASTIESTNGDTPAVKTYRPADDTDTDRPPAHDDHSHHRMPSTPWLLFDDLAKERVTYVDMRKALRDECPYLLFYQVQPIDEDLDLQLGDPPSYESVMNVDGVQADSSMADGNAVEGSTSEVNSATPSVTDPTTSDLSTLSLSIPSEHARSSFASETSQSTEATGSTITNLTNLKPLQDPQITNALLPTSQSANLASLHGQSRNPPNSTGPRGVDGEDHSPARTDGLTMRPHSIDLSTLATATATAASTASALEPPLGRASMSSAERNSISLTDVGQRSSIYTASAKGGSSAPITPAEEPETKGGFLGIARSRRRSITDAANKSSWRRNRSRPTSQTGEGRMSLNLTSMGMSMGRLKAAVSKDRLLHSDSQEKADDSGQVQPENPQQQQRTGSPDKQTKQGTVRRRKSLRQGKKPKRRSGSLARMVVDGKDNGRVERPERVCSVM